jgi:predicted chitinase
MSDDPTNLACTDGSNEPTVTARIVLTPELLQRMAPHTPAELLEARTPCLQRMLDESDCATPIRAAVILARVITETLGFYLVREQPSPASGPHFEAYVGRMGNRTLAEAQATRGDGFLELTGEDNFHAYTAWSQARGLPVDFAAHPELVLDLRYLGLESAFYIVSHPGLIAAADAGDVDCASTWVNAGESKDIWTVKHGGLLDATEAAALNKANGWEPGDRLRKHGIWGLNETRLHFQLTKRVLGI